MPNLKLTDLKWGTLNNIRENDSNASGDRRRTSTNTAIRFATEKAFEKDTLAGISEFNGIVVHARITTFSSYQNRSSLLKQFILPSTASAETQDYVSYAYKVFIPEMECRPVPSSYNDPVLITYPDIYSDLETSVPIPPGTLVVVKYEDPGNLFNPRIVRVTGEPVAITGITVDEAGKKIFENGKPRVLGYTGDSKAYPVTQAKIYSSHFFDPSSYKTLLANKINTLDKSVQEKFAQAVKDFLKTYFDEGLDIKITYAYRSLAKQQQLKKTTKGSVASPGYSWHNYGAAVDIMIYDRNLKEWDENGASSNYVQKARGVFGKYGLINDIQNDGGHFYPKKFGKSPARQVRSGAVTLESLIT